MSDEIISLYKEGKPFSEIAVLCGRTRGQVAGVVFRHRRSLTLKPAKIEPAPLELTIETEENVDLMDLKPHSCRFPTSSRGSSHLFCGKMIHAGSYCKEHHELTHTTSHIKPKTTAHYR